MASTAAPDIGIPGENYNQSSQAQLILEMSRLKCDL